MSRSAALQKFAERLDEVKRLLQLCTPPGLSLKKQKARVPTDNALLRGALVLLCSHIEGFFEDLVSEALSAYVSLVQVEKIPWQIVALQVGGRQERWNNCNISTRWEIINGIRNHPLIAGTKDGAVVPIIDAELHVKGFANPGSREIENLLSSIGISAIWEKFLKEEGNQAIKAVVDGIVNRRNQIAHGQMESTVTRGDVERYVTQVQRIAEVMDKIVDIELCACVGRDSVWILLQENAER